MSDQKERKNAWARSLAGPSAALLCSAAGTCSPQDRVSCSFSSATDLAKIYWARPEPSGWAKALLVSFPLAVLVPWDRSLGGLLFKGRGEGAGGGCGVGVPSRVAICLDGGPSNAASPWDVERCATTWGWGWSAVGSGFFLLYRGHLESPSPKDCLVQPSEGPQLQPSVSDGQSWG